MGYAGSQGKPFDRQRLFALLDKLPLWAGYLSAVVCSAGLGYSWGSARSGFPDPRQGQITLVAVAAGALLFILILDLTLRAEERRRAQRAEQLRLSKETLAVELLDPVDREVLDALDRIADSKGIDRATLIPAILNQYIARKAHEAAAPDRGRKAREAPPSESEGPTSWLKTLPAWLETLPGSLDIKSR